MRKLSKLFVLLAILSLMVSSLVGCVSAGDGAGESSAIEIVEDYSNAPKPEEASTVSTEESSKAQEESKAEMPIITEKPEFKEPAQYCYKIKLTVNPEFVFYLEKDGSIISVQSINGDAELIMASLENPPAGQNIKDVIKQIFSQAKTYGMLKTADDEIKVELLYSDAEESLSKGQLNEIADAINEAAKENEVSVKVSISIGEDVVYPTSVEGAKKEDSKSESSAEESSKPEEENSSSNEEDKNDEESKPDEETENENKDYSDEQSEEASSQEKQEPGICKTCGGTGNCGTCEGGGVIKCRECDGYGVHSCEHCNGLGYYPCDCQNGICSVCNGGGHVWCPYCDGYDEDCEYCDGTHYIVCEECGGNGLCPKCDGRNVSAECEYCEGNGYIVCSTCDGMGIEECPDCGGTGNCPVCDGEGEVE